MSFVTTDELSMSVTKITSRIGASSTHSLPFCFFSKFKLEGTMTDTKKNGGSKSIVHAIKHANFQLYRVNSDGVI